jgi:hypothetical protein
LVAGIKKFVSHKSLSFFTVFFFLLIYLFVKDVTEFYHDAKGYWEYGRTFVRNGEFHIANYNYPMRGYLLPFICYIIQTIAQFLSVSEYIIFRVICAIFSAYSLTNIIPNFFSKLFNLKFQYLSRVTFSILFIFFWDGLLLYPLSDFSVVLVVISLNYLLELTKTKENEKGIFKLILNSLLMGICLGGAYYIRPIYLSVLILIFGFMMVYPIFEKDKNLKIRTLTLIFSMVGLLITTIPQIIINSNNFQTFSPTIQTQYDNPSNRSLYLTQLDWGIYIQRYESNVGETYPGPQIFFMDDMGKKIIETEGISYIQSYQQYFKVVIKYPVDFICIYARHIFNGLDHVYSDIFIKDINQNRIFFSFLNYSIIFIALSSIVYQNKRNRKIIWKFPEVALFLIFLSTVVLSIPTAVETRFFLPVYIIMYIFVSSLLTIDNFRKLDVTLLLKRYSLAYFLFIIICFVLSSSVFTTIEHGFTVLGQ